jgi:hypothetical protein
MAEEVGRLAEQRREVTGVLGEVHPPGPLGARAVAAPVEQLEPPPLGERALLGEGELAEAHASVDEHGPRPLAPDRRVQVGRGVDAARIGHVRGHP